MQIYTISKGMSPSKDVLWESVKVTNRIQTHVRLCVDGRQLDYDEKYKRMSVEWFIKIQTNWIQSIMIFSFIFWNRFDFQEILSSSHILLKNIEDVRSTKGGNRAEDRSWTKTEVGEGVGVERITSSTWNQMCWDKTHTSSYLDKDHPPHALSLIYFKMMKSSLMSFWNPWQMKEKGVCTSKFHHKLSIHTMCVARYISKFHHNEHAHYVARRNFTIMSTLHFKISS